MSMLNADAAAPVNTEWHGSNWACTHSCLARSCCAAENMLAGSEGDTDKHAHLIYSRVLLLLLLLLLVDMC